jgi:hypothetical protein
MSGKLTGMCYPNLAKVGVEGSSPFARSKIAQFVPPILFSICQDVPSREPNTVLGRGEA